MPKRTWTDANIPPLSPFQPSTLTHQPSFGSPIHSARLEFSSHEDKPLNCATNRTPKATTNSSPGSGGPKLPSISRKVKACAACRKQKIKCIMPKDPPCQRCKERGLPCRLNKSLQTLMSEDSRWKSYVTQDISQIHASLEQVLHCLNLPAIAAPRSAAQEPAMFFDPDDQGNEQDDDDRSPDESPKLSPIDEKRTPLPIESLYLITGVRALKAQDVGKEEHDRICKQLRDSDFISTGLINIGDAEYLAEYYLSRLDGFIWHLASDYHDLDSFRKRSPTLTACILAVAALHDTTKPGLYEICYREYLKRVSSAMFERHIDMEYLRALVIGSCWLGDNAWTLIGYAVRRAYEFHLGRFFYQITESIEEPDKYSQRQLRKAMDGMRMLYLLYLFDQYLSLLYGRPSIIRDSEYYINGCELYLQCSLVTSVDKRIVAQVLLLSLMNRIREKFDSEDSISALPASSLQDIIEFEQELDAWRLRFSNQEPDKDIGNWPNTNSAIHYHFAKLYLDSHAMRGLPGSDSNEPVIPDYFLNTAFGAVSSATGLLKLLTDDPDAQEGLMGSPHHVHGLIAFACMFLLKVATKHSNQLYVDMRTFQHLIARLAKQLKVTEVGKEHLIHRMAGGLEKMSDAIDAQLPLQERASKTTPASLAQTSSVGQIGSSYGHFRTGQNLGFQPTSMEINLLDPTSSLSFGDPMIGLGFPFFDFENTNQGTDESFPFLPQ